MTPIWF
jgi:hypothetical protein